MRRNALLAAVLMILFMAIVYYLPNADLDFPVIEIEAPQQHIGLVFVSFGSLKIDDCEASRRRTFEAVMKACGNCRVVRNGCFPPDEEIRQVIGLKPLPRYSVSGPGSYIVYKGENPAILRELCLQTAEGLRRKHVAAACLAPNENRLPR